MYLYVKAFHIIFIVTWFAGLFYMPRLLIYTVEAIEKKQEGSQLLIQQFKLMQKRLWYGITWPSAIITLIFGTWMLVLYGSIPNWMVTKLLFVVGLYIYHYLTHLIFKQQQQDVFKYSSMKLRIWNEVATLFLVAIVFLVVVKDGLAWANALGGMIVFILVLLAAIKIYKKVRKA